MLLWTGIRILAIVLFGEDEEYVAKNSRRVRWAFHKADKTNKEADAITNEWIDRLIGTHTVWNTDLSLEKNVLFSLPLFYNFVRYSNKIDGFVYELPSNVYGRNLCEFSLSTKRVP